MKGKILTKKVNPDDRGRVALGGLVDKKFEYNATRLDDGTVILTPFITIEVKPSEAWLFNNPQALLSLKKGIQQSKEGKVKKRRSYSEFANIEID